MKEYEYACDLINNEPVVFPSVGDLNQRLLRLSEIRRTMWSVMNRQGREMIKRSIDAVRADLKEANNPSRPQ